MRMPSDEGDRHDGIIAPIVSQGAEEIRELASNDKIAATAFQLQKDEIGALGDDLTNAPLQLFLHRRIERSAHNDPPSVGSSALERVAVKHSGRQSECLDHFLRR